MRILLVGEYSGVHTNLKVGLEKLGAEVLMVEGVFSAKAAMRLAEKYHVELPIIEQVNEVLFHGKTAAAAVKDLMIRDKKIEIAHDEEWGEVN